MMSTEPLADDEPLDPTLERVKRKMLRLLFVSIFILMSALVAIFVAIVYKSRAPAPTPSVVEGQNLAANLDVTLPPGARVEETVLNGDRLLVTLRLAGGGTQLLVIGLREGQVLSRVRLQPAD